MNTKQKYISRLFLPWLFILLSSCNIFHGEINFPETEIVFQLTTLQDDSGNTDYKVGFVNSDGSGRSVFIIPRGKRWKGYLFNNPKSIVFPVITDDSQTMIFRTIPFPENSGNLIIYKVGEDAVTCDTERFNLWYFSRPSIISNELILVSVYDFSFPLGFFEIDTCGLSVSPQEIIESEISYYDIGNGDVTSDFSWIVYSQWRNGQNEIILRNLETEEERYLGEGIEPVWSPNDNSIAYISSNGISIVDIHGNNMLLVRYQNPERGGRPAIEGYWPPLVSWSPDSQWLTYHKCTLSPRESTWCREVENFSIFRVNVHTGEEFLVVEGGLNPYWKK
jgi:hypothetical protein